MSTLIINGLVKKRNELVREQYEHEDAVKKLKADIAILEKAIKVFKPSFNLKTLKAKRKYRKNTFFFGKSQQAGTTLIDVMREAGEPLNTLEIAERAAVKIGLNYDEIDQEAFQKGLRPSLKILSDKGIFQQVKRVKNGLIVWEIAP